MDPGLPFMAGRAYPPSLLVHLDIRELGMHGFCELNAMKRTMSSYEASQKQELCVSCLEDYHLHL